MSDCDYSDEAAALALEAKFEKNKRDGKNAVFIWTFVKTKGGVGYGSYKYVTKESLAERKYKVTFADYAPSVEYTDVWFDPTTNTYSPRSETDTEGEIYV